VPIVLEGLAAAWRQGFAQREASPRIAYLRPYGPPQGKLDPHLAEFLAGRLHFAFLTREISEADLSTFRRHHAGMDPLVIPVAGGSWNRFGFVDPVVVIVNAANPLQALDLKRLDAIFTTSRSHGGAAIVEWGMAGVPEWRGRPIRIVGGEAWVGEESARALFLRRNVFSANGTRGVWRQVPGSGGETDNVQRVADDSLALGFTGLGHLLPGTRALSIIPYPDAAPVAPVREAIVSGRYPFTRTVDLLLARVADGRIDTVSAEFALFLLGAAGQAIDARQGDILPLNEAQRNASLRLMEPPGSPSISHQSKGAHAGSPLSAATARGSCGDGTGE
jgi:phosphate transport system substrate-binding protein